MIRPKHSLKIEDFISRFGYKVDFLTRSCEEYSIPLLIKPKRSFQKLGLRSLEKFNFHFTVGLTTIF